MSYSRKQWRRLGRLLRAERGDRSRDQIAEASGVGTRTIQRYESGQAFDSPPGKLWKLMTFYRWHPDSLHSVLTGGDPIYLPEPPAPALPTGDYELVLQLVRDAPQGTFARRQRQRILGHFKDRQGCRVAVGAVEPK